MTTQTEIERDLIDLITAVKADIHDDYRAFEEDSEPGIQLTVGATIDRERLDDTASGDEILAAITGYDWQTGDNSYSGAAYFHPYWGVVGVYRDSDPAELATEIVRQIIDQTSP